jgi:adenylosuccinate lyase
MAAGLVGDQWNEGDVSCSVVRRAVLPDAFFALDGLLETFLTVLGQMEVFAEVVASENRRYMPFLATTTVLMEAVKAGLGREAAHAVIKENAVATLGDLRAGSLSENDLMARLAADERLPLKEDQLNRILAEAEKLTGLAQEQVEAWAASVDAVIARFPEAAAYEPGSIL